VQKARRTWFLKLEQATAKPRSPWCDCCGASFTRSSGNSAMMGFAPIEKVAHRLEDVCAEMAVQGSARRRAQIQLLLDGCDLLLTSFTRLWAVPWIRPRRSLFLQQISQPDSEPSIASAAVTASSTLPVTLAVTENDEARSSTRIADDDIDGLLELAGETIVGQIDLTRVHSALCPRSLRAERYRTHGPDPDRARPHQS